MVGLGNWAMPAFAESKKLATKAQQDRDLAVGLSAQLAALERQVGSPNAAMQASVASLRQAFANQEPEIQAVQKSLVTARNMPTFLQNLLAGNRGLQLISLETLAPEALINTAAATGDEAANKPKAAEGGIRLYKHGVRLRLSGSYRELMAYLSDLEEAPQRVLWGDMKLSVSNHPKIVLSLTVYTLSLDKAWMTL